MTVRPNPTTMKPMFSIDEYASSRFMSFCTALNTTPKIAVASPIASATTPHHQIWVWRRSNVTRSIP